MEASALPGAPARPGLRSVRRGGDERLATRARAGDERAFEAIFDRYNRPLLSFCRHMLGNPGEAEDAVQQTFLAAYRELAGTTKDIKLRPWLYTVARNSCLSILRARRESVPLDDAEPAVEGLTAEVARREDLRELLRDLGQLPNDQRAAILLAELGALSHQEIADVVGCRTEKVKALVFQARSSLSAGRAAREIPCGEIREQLATLSGGALRRTALRRHLRDCAGCREFRDEVRRQRAAMALILPVLPSAGLKTSVLAAATGAGTAGGGATAAVAGVAGSAASSGVLGASGGAAVAAKLAAVAVVALGAGAGAVAITSGDHSPANTQRATPAHASPAVPAPTATRARTLARQLELARHRRASVGRGNRRNGRDGRIDTKTHGAGAGRSGASRGRTFSTPGHSDSSPGRAHVTPASQAAPPGRTGASPGRAGTTPGLARTSPGLP